MPVTAIQFSVPKGEKLSLNSLKFLGLDCNVVKLVLEEVVDGFDGMNIFVMLFFFPINSSSKIYKKEKEEEEEEDLDEVVNITKSGSLFYSPPKTKHLPPEPRSRSNTNDSISSTAHLIIPEEGSDLHVLEQPEGKYSSRDARHGARHKHKRHERPLKKGGEFLSWCNVSL